MAVAMAVTMADSARDAMFGRIRRALGVSGDEADRRQAVAMRLGAHARNLVPSRADIDADARVALFRAEAEAVQTTVDEAGSLAEIPEIVADYLRRHNLPQRLRHGEDATLTGLPWERTPSLEVDRGPAQPADEVSLSCAFAGVAETGTLILISGPDNPTTLNFLPETHIVVLPKRAVTGSYEDVWDSLRARFGEAEMPRTVNMITGPSRTGDIEQRIELGAHGPRRLHIILVDA
jgi:L-lactate dehydrogenase complex protein LldG